MNTVTSIKIDKIAEMEILKSFFGEYRLQRLPAGKNNSLRAWDAADELLLAEVAKTELPPSILIINDLFGALSISLNKHQPTNWSDSYLAHAASKLNLKRNKLDENLNCVPSTGTPPGKYDLILIKIPKSNALLEQQLQSSADLLSDDGVMIAAGMSRHIHTNTLNIFEKQIGPTTTSKAVKKARLIFPQRTGTKYYEEDKALLSYTDPELELTLENHANVFSRKQLDIGSRFMIQQFEKLPSAERIIDLACGNGVLGIMAKRCRPQSSLLFSDESYMAVESARINFERYFDHKDAKFIVDNCLENYQGKKADLILCNPPFHQQHSIGDDVAWYMFNKSRRLLAKGGELWVVGNRHMNYHSKLNKVFGNSITLASNNKFVVLKSLN